MTHAHPNLAQTDKDSRMRSLFVANHGDKLVGADASGLELRLMAAYLHSVDGGKYADSVLYGSSKDGTDVHSINQRLWNLKSRDNAKIMFYSFLYGSGNANMGKTIIEDAIAAGEPKPKGRADQIGLKARKAIEEGITGLDQLIAYAQSMADQRGYLILPDGRPVKSTSRTALNSLLQGAGAVLMKKAAVIFDQVLVPERGLEGKFDYCCNVHDELQISARPEVAEAVGQALCDAMEMAGVELGYKVPFAGEYDVGDNWSQTH
jgi:DNA polymerase-1